MTTCDITVPLAAGLFAMFVCGHISMALIMFFVFRRRASK